MGARRKSVGGMVAPPARGRVNCVAGERVKQSPAAKIIIVIPDIISRKRKENIRNLRRKAGPPTPVVRPAQRIKPPSCYCSHSPLDTGAIPKKQHRHSGIFRVANFRPGTMPRGKYPESPAQAGYHALISRTPPP